MPLEGEHLGHYRLLRLLGSGGMGEVYLAEDARIGQQVAIKVIRTQGDVYPEGESAKEAVRLFEREARAIARLDHPNILPLYAYGEETLHEQPLTYLVMPYRKDGTLAQWVQQRRHTALLTLTDLVPLLQQAAAALQHAHDQQVIHQDIKPTNFLIRLDPDHPNRPDLFLADFGIARLTGATVSTSQSIRGTSTYMPPEQWEGHPVPATDQYALAIMLYELLVGRVPFQGGPGQMMRQHYTTLPPTPSSLNPRLSPAIDAVLLRALSKRPAERFASMPAFARAFQEATQYSGALQAVLAISQVEAENGTTRNLTLPEGRQVSIVVPAGISEGTRLHLAGQGKPYYTGGPVGSLLLSITIRMAEKSLPFQSASRKPTVSTSQPDLQRPAIEDLRILPGYQDVPSVQGPATVPPFQEHRGISLPHTLPATPGLSGWDPTVPGPSSTPLPIVPPVKGSGGRRFVLIGLAALVIVLSSGIIWLKLPHTIPLHANTSIGPITDFALPTYQSDAYGITAGPDGALWFTESSQDKIGRITTSGSTTEFALPTSNSSPIMITEGPDHNLWFTESSQDKIGRITTRGSITEFILPTLSPSQSDPYGITAGSDGSLWFTEANEIGRITTSGSITEFDVSTLSSSSQIFPHSITAGPDGALWFTEPDASKIGRITTSGSLTEFAIPTLQSYPNTIIAGPDHNLWFTESSVNKIGRITTSGSITEFALPTYQSYPYGIAAGPDGALWFTESDVDKIGRITTGGHITEFAASSVFMITAGPDGNLWFPNDNKIGRITSGK